MVLVQGQSPCEDRAHICLQQCWTWETWGCLGRLKRPLGIQPRVQESVAGGVSGDSQRMRRTLRLNRVGREEAERAERSSYRQSTELEALSPKATSMLQKRRGGPAAFM